MPIVISAPVVINDTAEKVKITSFAMDEARAECHVAFKIMTSADVVIAERMVSIEGLDFVDVLTRIEVINASAPNVRSAIKKALYEEITRQDTTLTGVVS